MARLGLHSVSNPDYASHQPMPYANPEERPVQKIEKFATFLNELPWFSAETEEEKKDREKNEEIERTAGNELAAWIDTRPVDEYGRGRDAGEVLDERNAKVGLVAGGYNPLLAEKQGIPERLEMAMALQEALEKRDTEQALQDELRAEQKRLSNQSLGEQSMEGYVPRDSQYYEPGFAEQAAYERRKSESRGG